MRAERHRLHHRRAGDAGERRDALHEIELHGVALARPQRVLEVECREQQPVGGEAEVLRLHAVQRAHEQPRPRDEQRAQRHLQRYERLLRRGAPRHDAVGAGVQLGRRVARRLRERRESGEHARHARRGHRRQHDDRVGAPLARREAGEQRQSHDVGDPAGDDEAARRAGRREQHALDEQQPREPRPADA